MKCELLSPAGNMEMLKYAIMYGADAVYLAGVRFGARKYANNFTDEELEIAIRYAHLYGVKVYITINTLIYEREVEDFLKYVDFIYNIGVDAVLVQDFGMLNLISKKFPNLEVHASTQMHNNSSEMCTLLESLGIKRVVLDREMSLEEIKNLPITIEKEVFCHGALCVSYSGQCLFSSQILGRSGNRGECAGMCRLPYRLKSGNYLNKDTKYYLSLKDLCTVDYVDKLIDAGVNSLKIEGRMKSPEYVGYMTKIYRELIDSYYEGHFKRLSDEERKNIALLFNRGFTSGYVMDAKNEDMANVESPNHIGIHLGKYIVKSGKIELILEDILEQGDIIRFKESNKGMTVNFLYDNKDNLVKSGDKLLYVDNFLDIEGTGEIRKVGSASLMKEINDLPKKKLHINMSAVIKSNEPMKLVVNDGVNTVVKMASIPVSALNQPITRESVEKQLLKTGSTIYTVDEVKIELDDNLFVNIKDLNELRRCALEELDEVRSSSKKEVTYSKYEDVTIDNGSNKFNLDVVVNTMSQYNVAKKYATNVYSSNEELIKLGCLPKYKDTKDRFGAGKYIISDYGSIAKIKSSDDVCADYMMNAVNSYTARELYRQGVSRVCLSVECTSDDIKNIALNTEPSILEVLIYGKIELMKMKYNPINAGESLIDRNNSEYKIKRDGKYNYLMSSNAIDKVSDIDMLIGFGIKNFRVDLFDEDTEKCEKILENLHKKICRE